MRIAITGASGSVGRQLVPILLERGAQVLLIGRDLAKLRAIFPNIPVAAYPDLAKAAAGFDALLHLAVINNDQIADRAEIERVNVDLPVQLCQQASASGVKKFIFVSSVHALDLGNTGEYAVSKRTAVVRLGEVDDIGRWVIYLPAVVGGRLSGKLTLVNRLPGPLRAFALRTLSALKPTVHVERIADLVMDLPATAGSAVAQRIITDGQGNNPAFGIAKRLIDLAFAASIIVLLWWAMLIIWAGIRLQSPGPGIFRQQRVGRSEQVFTCLKFRTMYLSAPSVGTHEVPLAAVTPLGHFLRRTKLDELPQVFNILRNDMSLVGPRPCLPTQTDMVTERRLRGVFAIKPGITGLAQVRGIDMSQPDKLAACDLEYLQLQSLLLDIKVILQTARGAGSGDRVGPPAPDTEADKA